MELTIKYTWLELKNKSDFQAKDLSSWWVYNGFCVLHAIWDNDEEEFYNYSNTNGAEDMPQEPVQNITHYCSYFEPEAPN